MTRDVRLWLLLLPLAACGEAPRASAPADERDLEATASPAPPPDATPDDQRSETAASATAENDASAADSDLASEAVFPCRPPQGSDSLTIDRRLLAAPGAAATLGDVGNRLAAAFAQAGYPNPHYYRTCGGFVMVAHVERMRSDGRPFLPGRFVDLKGRFSTIEDFSLRGIVTAILTVNPGRFRLVAVRVSDRAAAFGPALSPDDAKSLGEGGAPMLADAIAEHPFSATHKVLALVYEFERSPGAGAARLITPPTRTAMQNLQLAGLLPALQH